jgi:hypothetical protein
MNNDISHDVQDRPWWYIKGENLEKMACNILTDHYTSDEYRPSNRPTIVWNEEKNGKSYECKMLADAIHNGDPLEIKSLHTPFYTCKEYGDNFDANFCLTIGFNGIKNIRKQNIKKIMIWQQFVEKTDYTVHVYNCGRFLIVNFDYIEYIIKEGKAPVHEHLKRKDDPYNDKYNYLFDLGDPHFRVEYDYFTEKKELYLGVY